MNLDLPVKSSAFPWVNVLGHLLPKPLADLNETTSVAICHPFNVLFLRNSAYNNTDSHNRKGVGSLTSWA